MLSKVNKLWEELFLSLNEEEKTLAKLAPILLKCSKKDADTVGSLVWSHFVNNDEWKGTFRFTGRVIANILNKRFAVQEWNYLDFYMSNLRFWHSKKKMSSYDKERKRMESKYSSKVCVNCG